MLPKFLTRALHLSILLGSALFAQNASATFHLWQLSEFYSDASGTVQYIELSTPAGGQEFLSGHAISASQGAGIHTFNFPADLPGDTAGHEFLIGTQGFADLGIVSPDYIVPNGFLFLTNGLVDFAGVDSVTYSALPVDGVHALSRNGSSVVNAPTNFAGATGSIFAAQAPNYSDSWWNASESGWGITITDHDTSAFVQWYTYDQTGHNQKYVIADGAFSNGKCLLSGTIQHVTGPGWTLPAFDPAQVTRTTAGSGSIDFCPSGLAAGTIVFNYNNVDGVTGSKQLTRLPFGDDVPHWEGTANTGAADFTDLWWNSSEPGWGVSVTQHGNNLVFRIFVYDTDGRPLLFVVPSVTYNSASSFSGNVALTSGPWFGSDPFDPNQVVRTATPGNTATLTFSDANNGVLSYTVNGVTVTKLITRLAF